MATELNLEISRVEMERLQTSIKYHDWFLGFVVVVGVSLSVYVIKSMNAMQEGLHGVRAQIMVMQKDIDVMKRDMVNMKVDIETMKMDIETMKVDIETMKVDIGNMKVDIGNMKSDIAGLDRKMDRYHSGAGT